jgi:2-polyprenyl-3-methyl-5-hydroxy-6-metoxy-1,4-benzoquinol methylase
MKVNIQEVKQFWENNPVAVAGISAQPGTKEFYEIFDKKRESFAYEPYEFSNLIHDYALYADKKVLDYGCGNGYVLHKYAENNASVFGLDITEKAIELSKKRFQLYGLEGKFNVVDGNSIPFENNYFDVVCSMGVLHHISNPEPMIAELERVLKPEGKIIIMLYNKRSFKNLIFIPILKLLHPKYKNRSLQEIRNMNDGEECPLALVYDKNDIRKMLRNFTELKFYTSQITWGEILFFRRFGFWLDKNIPFKPNGFVSNILGWNLYCKATKPK